MLPKSGWKKWKQKLSFSYVIVKNFFINVFYEIFIEWVGKRRWHFWCWLLFLFDYEVIRKGSNVSIHNTNWNETIQFVWLDVFYIFVFFLGVRISKNMYEIFFFLHSFRESYIIFYFYFIAILCIPQPPPPSSIGLWGYT